MMWWVCAFRVQGCNNNGRHSCAAIAIGIGNVGSLLLLLCCGGAISGATCDHWWTTFTLARCCQERMARFKTVSNQASVCDLCVRAF